MLITLCYLYLWARWGRGPSALVRSTVRRLRTSRCSFTFCGAAAQPGGARVCLTRGGRVFCVGESQVGGGAGTGGGAGGRRRPCCPAASSGGTGDPRSGARPGDAWPPCGARPVRDHRAVAWPRAGATSLDSGSAHLEPAETSSAAWAALRALELGKKAQFSGFLSESPGATNSPCPPFHLPAWASLISKCTSLTLHL